MAVSNWISETCSTVGGGNLVLTGAKDNGHIKFSEGMSAGDVPYSIEDGTNKESGIGTFNGTNSIIRNAIEATVIDGVYNNTNPVTVSLTGNAIVSVTFNALEYNNIITELAARADINKNVRAVIDTDVLYMTVDGTDPNDLI